MKYDEIIHVNNNFIPVFDIENEIERYWTLFVPNEKFKKILKSVINSLSNPTQKNPVWLQGSYGTGKSHATSVIKHLICDEEIPEDFNLESNELTAKLENFRKNYKVFPVVLKGTSTIGDSHRFSSTIQRAVKRSLDEQGIKIDTQSEFDHIIDLLENRENFLTQKDIENTRLSLMSYDEIIMRLKNQESDVLHEIEDILMNMGLNPFTHENIEQWLIKVRNELKEKYEYDYLMIFWDEFTGALNSFNVEDILLQIQNIAESKNNGISLFIVSHRTKSSQPNVNQEVIDKIMDRFEKFNYSMEPVATFELMERSIKKEQEWKNVKNRFIDNVYPIIQDIVGNHGTKVKKALENLYPIHPYTAYLSTLVAREIGSTERSIFRFLHDDVDYGFKQFITEFEINDRYFLTSDYLWDFFYEDFDQMDDEKIRSAVQKYKLHASKLKDKPEILVVFKVILLLNILYKMAQLNENSLAIPSRKNIKNIFKGSIYSNIDDVLNYIDDKEIIHESPSNIFEISTNILDPIQVQKEKESLKKSNISDMLTSNQQTQLKKDISEKIIRKSIINIPNTPIKKNLIRNIFEKNTTNPAYLNIYLFLCKDIGEFNSIKNFIQDSSNYNLLENKIIIISETVLGNKFNKYLEFKASSNVAKKYNYTDEINRNDENVEKIIDDWISDFKQNSVICHLNGESKKILFSLFEIDVNHFLSKQIFYNGLENIDKANTNRNIWKNKKSKSVAERYLSSDSYEELLASLSSELRQTTLILKDNNDNLVVNSQLELKEDISENHPLKIIQDSVDETFELAQQKGNFNLATELSYLNDVPYGLYSSPCNIAALSLVLKKYVNKFYDFSSHPIDEIKMKEKVMALFKYWDGGKDYSSLNVRFGSKYETKLIDLLKDIFNISLDSDRRTIHNIRWEIRKWTKVNTTPIWLLKYSSDINKKLIYALNKLDELLKPEDDKIPDTLLKETFESLDEVRIDFKTIIREDYKTLFSRFILENNSSDVETSDIPDIIAFIKDKMQEEVHDWDEKDVKNLILEWILDKAKQNEKIETIPKLSEEKSSITNNEKMVVDVKEEINVKDSEKVYDLNDGEKQIIKKDESNTIDKEIRINNNQKDNLDSNINEKIIPHINEMTIITKIKNTDANLIKHILIKALEEHQEIQTIFNQYLEK